MMSSNLRRVLTIVLSAVILLAVGGGGYLMLHDRAAAQEQGQGESLRSAVIERGDLRETVSVAARVEARERAELTFNTTGEVTEVNVEVGERVQSGDVLMALDTTALELDVADAEYAVELQQIALEQLRAGPSDADIAAAQAAVQQAEAQLAQLAEPVSDEAVRLAQSQLQLRESEREMAYARWTQALNEHNQDGQHPQVQIAQRQAEAAELAVQIATLELANAQEGAPDSDIASARAQVRQAQATLSTLVEGAGETDVKLAALGVERAEAALASARATLADATVVAPFAGVVAAVNFKMGERAAPGVPAVVLLDTSDYFIDLMVDEIDIIRIDEGQPATATLDAYPEAEVVGRVQRISPIGQTSGPVTTYEVRLALEPVDVPLRDGMTATVEIVVSELTDTLLVPNWAVRFDRATGQAYANVRQPDGTIEEVEVELGVRGGETSEVKSGLSAGDEVVVSLEREGFDLFGEEGE